MATSTRKPQKHVVHETKPGKDGNMQRFDTVKTLWRHACFMRKDLHREDGTVKKVWVPNAVHTSLRQFVRQLAASGKDGMVRARDWLANKKANTSNPPKGIGRTNGKK